MVVAEYAVYKGEEIIAMGTADELAKEFGVKKSLIYEWASRNFKNRGNSKRKFAIRVD